jgi:hypothetical protein
MIAPPHIGEQAASADPIEPAHRAGAGDERPGPHEEHSRMTGAPVSADSDAGERIRRLIDELDDGAHTRLATPSAQDGVDESVAEDVVRTLRRVEESVNSVRLSLGEEPVEILTVADGGR